MSAKIYCIECLETGEKYIGSTEHIKLYDRIYWHIKDLACSSKEIISRGNYKYYILEEVDISQRYIKEQYYMDTTDNCINKRRAMGITKKEYYQLNRDKLLQKNNEYNKLNKDKIKKYHQLNKDKLKEYDKQRNKYKYSWGGDMRSSNNLLLIDLSLFNY